MEHTISIVWGCHCIAQWLKMALAEAIIQEDAASLQNTVSMLKEKNLNWSAT